MHVETARLTPSQNQPLSSLTHSLKISQQTHVTNAQLFKYGFLGVVTSDFMVSFSYQSHRNTELKLAVIFRNAIIVPHQTFPMVAKSSTA
ncbi:hypothetical protein T4B_4180 [Trichinella pseudospiralis]|uniref:Uncharacterized protein n=1 Tax=Trichinella pseudospiralis TaxID=6337 RepID=A0A0V1K9C5_TRIPS|nr:hypothetical protein T4A_2201 [Trichinella pseudospiralis]KRZ14428.1 hypothetical protein T4B_4180 [Trichinella pseudospiralis]KRZ43788.1 hypothetical protein T4C_11412 [Trichinella pseudospiralis]